MIQLLGLVHGFAGHVDAQLAKEVQIHLRQDHRGVHLAVFQVAQLLHGDLRRGVGGGADGEGQQRLVRVEPGVVVPQMVHLQMLDGLDAPSDAGWAR